MKFKLSSRLALQVFFVFLLLLSSTAVIIPQPVQATASWYDSSWGYRKQITINGSSAGAQSNYQMRLTVHKGTGSDSGANVYLGSNVQDDFDDIRFTKSDGSTLLDYWIESYTSGTLAVVWIEFDSIPTSGSSANFYIYYGNSGASSGSNGANTFIFFDDFERGSDNDTVGGSWSVGGATIKTAQKHSGTRSAFLTTGTSYMHIDSSVSANKAYGFWIYKIDACTNMSFEHGNGTHVSYTRIDGSENIYYVNGAGGSVDTGLNTAAATWREWEIKNLNFTAPSYTVVENGSAANCTDMYDSTDRSNQFWLINYDTGHEGFYVDDFIIRNYCNPEPTWGTWGSEEFYGATVTTGICSGSGTTWAVLNGNITDLGPSGNSVTQRGFEYGLDTSYGTSVLISGMYGAGNYAVNATGLSPSTIYHYRAKVYNGIWSYGADAIFATKGLPAITTYFNTGDDNQTDIYGVNVAGQTFTTSATTQYTVTSVRLKMLRVGNPGTVTVSIRRATAGANNTPTGVDITSGTINGNSLNTSTEWYEIAMNTEVPLELNMPYAIVVSAVSGDGSNYVRWRQVNAGGLSGGNGVTSANSGISWTARTYDHLFELWGNQSLEIQDVKVFQSYKEIGDWLITVRYVNTYAPYYDSYDVRKYFALQLVDSDSNVKASTAVPAWGNKVGNIYISTTSATALTYGGNYKVRIYGTFTGNPYTEYALTTNDWLGDDLRQLDSWVITSASVIGNYYGQILTVDIPGRGEVLNAAGGTIFTAGINGLPTVRPEIYQISTSPTGYTPAPTAQTYRQSFNWQAAWGPEGTVMLTRIANVFGVDGSFIGGMFFIIMLFALALLAFPAGHTTAANILSIPCLGLAVFFGLDIIYIVILALFAAFLLFKNQFMDK